MIRLWFLISALWASVATAQSTLDRLDRPGETLGWEAIGRLDLPGGYCTGTLISDDLVLTAAHCVVDSTGRLYPGQDVLFHAGYTNGRSVASRRARQIVVAPGYQPRSDGMIDVSNMPHDVALVRLARPISKSEASPFSLHDTPQKGDRVSFISYGKDRDEVMSWQRNCSVLQRYRGGLMSFDCAAVEGSSGAPVLVRYGSRVRILSMISGGVVLEGNQPVALGMTLPDVVTTLKARIGEGRTVAQKPAVVNRLAAGERGNTGARFVRP